MLEQAFNSRLSHAGRSSSRLSEAADQIMQKKNRGPNQIKGVPLCVFHFLAGLGGVVFFRANTPAAACTPPLFN